jgi:hypothetical protein
MAPPPPISTNCFGKNNNCDRFQSTFTISELEFPDEHAIVFR